MALSTRMDQEKLEREILLMRQIGTDSQRYEVKSCEKGLTKDIAQTISAFSNGAGGFLICGISETDGFVPVEGFNPKSIQDALANVCVDKLTPPVRPIIQSFLFEDRPVIVAEIPEMPPSEKPCYVTASRQYDGSYIRTGDGDRRLTSYEVDRLLDEHRQPRYDGRIVEEATLADLDRSLVDALLARERRIHSRNFAKLTDEEALIKLTVAKRDDEGVLRPTLAGLMALGEYPQQFFPRLNVSFACYPGTTKSEVSNTGQRLLDSQSIVGPISYMIEDSIGAITRNMRTGAVVDGAFRGDVPDYPVVALREALANALMHRDYSSSSIGTPVQVDMYVDRLEIINPGGLFGNVTMDMLGKDCISASRNQFLANLLESTPYGVGQFVAENRGTGYQTIEASLSEALMPAPIPRDTISFFSLTFGKRRISNDEMAMASSESVRSVVLGLLEKQKSISTTEVVKSSRWSRATVVKRLNEMIEQGTIETTEPKGSTKQRYRLVR